MLTLKISQLKLLPFFLVKDPPIKKLISYLFSFIDLFNFPLINKDFILKGTFKNSLNIISKVVNQQYKGVKLTPSTSSLHLISSNTESEIGEDQIDAQYDGEELSIGFNISYIQDVIDILSSESIHICINDQNSGCILLGDSDKKSVFVIMPMRI